MANQFITSVGSGSDDDEDQKTLAAGVNAGQALPNMDPTKSSSPAAAAAQSISQNVVRPPAAAATPAVTGSSRSAASPTAPPAAAPPPAAGQPSGQNPPNPYMAKAMTASSPTATPAQMAATNASSGAPVSSGVTAAGGWQPTTPTQYSTPTAGTNSVFDPTQYDAYGGLLASEAAGNLTPAQQLANKQNFASQYYNQGMQASDQSAGRGLTGDSGVSRDMQQTIAGNIADAQTNANAALQQTAQQQLGQYEQAGLGNSQFEQSLTQSQDALAQQAQAAFNNTMTQLAGQTNQANISQNQINAQENQPFYSVGANIVGAGIKSAGSGIYNYLTSPIAW